MSRPEYLDELKEVLGEDYDLQVIEIVSKQMNKSFKAGENKAKKELLEELEKVFENKINDTDDFVALGIVKKKLEELEK